MAMSPVGVPRALLLRHGSLAGPSWFRSTHIAPACPAISSASATEEASQVSDGCTVGIQTSIRGGCGVAALQPAQPARPHTSIADDPDGLAAAAQDHWSAGRHAVVIMLVYNDAHPRGASRRAEWAVLADLDADASGHWLSHTPHGAAVLQPSRWLQQALIITSVLAVDPRAVLVVTLHAAAAGPSRQPHTGQETVHVRASTLASAPPLLWLNQLVTKQHALLAAADAWGALLPVARDVRLPAVRSTTVLGPTDCSMPVLPLSTRKMRNTYQSYHARAVDVRDAVAGVAAPVVAAAFSALQALAVLEAHSHSVTLVVRVCHVLCTISASDTARVAIAAAGGIAAMLAALQRHQGSKQVAKAACAVLSHVLDSADNRAAAVAAGGVPVLVATLHTHRKQSLVVHFVCGMLAKLAADAGHLHLVLTSQGVHAILGALGTCRKWLHLGLATTVTEALWQCSRTDAGVRALLVADGINALQRAMRHHAGCPAVAIRGFGVLARLLSASPQRQPLATTDTLKAITVALNEHHADAPSLQGACRVLGMCVTWRCPHWNVPAGLVPAAVRTLRHQSSAGTVEAREVAEACCKALWSLSINWGQARCAAAAGGLQALEALLLARPPSAVIAERCCTVMSDIVMAGAGVSGLISAAGVDAVVGVLRVHRSSATIAAAACDMLAQVTRAGSRCAIAHAGGCLALVNAMTAHSSHRALAASACVVLADLAATDELHDAIDAAGAIDALVHALRTHVSSLLVAMSACKVISRLARHTRPRSAMHAAGAGLAIASAIRWHASVPVFLESARVAQDALNGHTL